MSAFLMLAGVMGAAGQAGPPGVLAFSPAGSNGYTFDTGVVRGKLRADGMSKGLSSVRHVPTGLELDRSLGLCSHYRVFTAGKRYGVAAWEWPSAATLERDGSVMVHWPANSERPFELRARYRWATPNALDVETSVVARGTLEKFESFLACYFAPAFSNSLVYVQEQPHKTEGPGFLSAEKTLGPWLAFPRDNAATALIRDGRWKLPPNPVDWVVMPEFAKPIGVRSAPTAGLTAVLMAAPDECFAICTPEETDPHDSLYLSLFGRDLAPGETARARTRLLIGDRLSAADIMAAYENYLRALAAGG